MFVVVFSYFWSKAIYSAVQVHIFINRSLEEEPVTCV